MGRDEEEIFLELRYGLKISRKKDARMIRHRSRQCVSEISQKVENMDYAEKKERHSSTLQKKCTKIDNWQGEIKDLVCNEGKSDLLLRKRKTKEGKEDNSENKPRIITMMRIPDYKYKQQIMRTVKEGWEYSWYHIQNKKLKCIKSCTSPCPTRFSRRDQFILTRLQIGNNRPISIFF